jgi:hypothetical protein
MGIFLLESSLTDTLQAPRAAVSWERYEGSQTAGVQAVSGLPVSSFGWSLIASCWLLFCRRRSRQYFCIINENA